MGLGRGLEQPWGVPLPVGVDEVFARRLKEVREQAGVTQAQLADRMTSAGQKMHRSAIAKIETNQRPVLLGEAVWLAVLLGVQLIDLTHDPHADTVTDQLRQYRANAQIEVAALTHEVEEKQRNVRDAEAVLRDALNRLDRAQRHLADIEKEQDE